MKNREEILGILLPDQGEQFLLPNVSIAEIFTLQSTDFQQDEIPSADIGIIGTVTWRNTTLPLYHLSPLLNPEARLEELDMIDRPRVAVINPVTQPGHPCFAILATSTPRLTRLKSSDLTMESPMSSFDSLAYRCNLAGETVLIPDLLHIERQTLGKA